MREASFVNAWRELSEQAIVPNPFFDPDFCLPAIDALAKGAVHLAVVYGDGGVLIAAAPIYVSRFAHVGPKTVHIWTHDYIPLGTPLVHQGYAFALNELLSGISATYDAPVLCNLFKGFDHFDLNSGDLNVEALASFERAAMMTSLSGEEYRKVTLSKQRRQGLNRRYRRLAERTAHLGPLCIELCSDPDTVPNHFETFMRVEKLGWKGSKQSALLNAKPHADFARAVAVRLSSRGAFVVATLKAGDTILAALTLLKAQGEYFSWKTSYDESFAECSPGNQMLARFTDELMEQGNETILDSCAAPDNALANAIWSERVAVKDLLFIHPSQKAAGLAVRNMMNLHREAKQTVKSLIKRV
ncbi:MAG: GNAT family N-acetyltransferase [Hyphomicrobiales bacterium]